MHLESIDSAWHLPHLVMFTSQYFIHDINHEKKKICCICDIAVFFFYVIRYGRKFLGIMHGLHSAAKQSTVQCSNLFVAAPKRKQKMRKKSMLAMLQIEKKLFWYYLPF